MAVVSHSCNPEVSDVEARGTGDPRKPELHSEALAKTTKQDSERFSVTEIVAEWELVLQFDPQNQIKKAEWGTGCLESQHRRQVPGRLCLNK